ncbi:hypothetical protein OAT67_07250 [Bacteriovoracaceae bacterium]|nr:hypothetical protein [Bacteriovoracaceae bacterium]
MGLEKWHAFFQYFGLVSLVLALIGGFGTYVTGNQIKKVEEIERDAKKKKILDLEKQVEAEKNKIKTFASDVQITFVPNWDVKRIGNGIYRHALRA